MNTRNTRNTGDIGLTSCTSTSGKCKFSRCRCRCSRLEGSELSKKQTTLQHQLFFLHELSPRVEIPGTFSPRRDETRSSVRHRRARGGTLLFRGGKQTDLSAWKTSSIHWEIRDSGRVKPENSWDLTQRNVSASSRTDFHNSQGRRRAMKDEWGKTWKFPSSLSGSRDHSPFFLSPSITSPSDKVLTVLSAGRPNTLLPLHYLSLPSSRPCTHMLTRPFCLLIAHTLRSWRSTLGTFFKKPSCRWHVTSVLSKEKYIVWRLDSPQTVNIYTETMYKYWMVGIFWWDK